MRFRYSTDAAYLDTGWFVDDVAIGGAAATLSSTDWIQTTGEQDNNWLVQVVSPCDLTPGVTSAGESVVGDTYLYRFEGDLIQQGGFSTSCLRGATKARNVTVAVSNLPTGDLTVLDADYLFRVGNTSNRR